MEREKKKFDVIVIGGGHAGCEAALATSRLGLQTLLLTMNVDKIGWMSCNPSIGGIGKGHLVKEIDALGGEMALNTDKTAIQYRYLNTNKGPAVRATRCQCDMYEYHKNLRDVVEREKNLIIKQAVVEKLLVEGKKIKGVRTELGMEYESLCVIVTTGTFLNGLMHIGFTKIEGGRAGEGSAKGFSESLKEIGFKIGRLKTGTTPRLSGKTIDFSKISPQYGDKEVMAFSFIGNPSPLPQLPCYITYTNEKTHKIILENIHRSPLYTGVIVGIGPRYCPSIETKVVRFRDKERHQVFIEPEGIRTDEYYPNGLSTSLPIDVQIKILRSIKGLEEVEIVRPGYAVEYDFVEPTQVYPTLETKIVDGLFLAGQILGTTGYEEASALGIIAGINAAMKIMKNPSFILKRSEAYTAVMIDDLTTKGVREPYRMFTSRAEYRLNLREDNADERLTPIGRKIGLVSDERWEKFKEKKEKIAEIISKLKKTRVKKGGLKLCGKDIELKKNLTLEEVLRRPEIKLENLAKIIEMNENISKEIIEGVETRVKYDGYIKMQNEQIKRFKKLEDLKIPYDINYNEISGLSKEVVEKLSEIRPFSIAQAFRIEGITPSSIFAILIYLKKMKIF